MPTHTQRSLTVKLGSDAQFTALRSLLDDAGYTEELLCSRYGLSSLAGFEKKADEAEIDPMLRDTASMLLRLFVETRYLRRDDIDAAIGHSGFQLLIELGLLEQHPTDGRQWFAPVTLYPTNGFYIVSDRWLNPDRSAMYAVDDVVYPPIVSNGQQFVTLLPKWPCSRMLDLCSGSGIGALIAARDFAGQAWSLDVAPRSAHFAEFNRRLNGLANVSVGAGDLYDPVRGLRFDFIAAHPPYVPVLRPRWIYHDGGTDGEQIARRAVEGLPLHLEPGGRFYMRAMGSDRRDGTYEQRIRGWLGEMEGEFDIAVVDLQTIDPIDFAMKSSLKSTNAASDAAAFGKVFAELGIERMVIAATLIQRKTDDRPAFTVRRHIGWNTDGAALQWLMDWESTAASPTATNDVLTSPLYSARQAELRVVHQLEEGEWRVGEHVLAVNSPFSMEVKTDAWVPYLMSIADGTSTTGEYLEILQRDQVLPPEASPEEFARAIATFISGGFFTLHQQ